MTRLTIQVITLLFLVLFSACQQNKHKEAPIPTPVIEKKDSIPSAMQAISARGDTLVALTCAENASFFIYKGHTLGYEYEMVNKLAEHLDLELKIVLVENPDSLIPYLAQGKGDLIAYAIRANNKLSKEVSFTNRLYGSPQCLIQRKPLGWQNMMPHQINHRLIRSVLDIKDEALYIPQNSHYENYLYRLSDDIGDSLNIIPIAGTKSIFDLIEMVAEGTINYTVADEEIASMYAAYNGDIDYATTVSMPQKKAWAVRHNSPELLSAINQWLDYYQRYKAYYFIFDKYYNNPATLKKIRYNQYASHKGKLSKYDKLIKEEAKTIEWDWRLLAAQIYQESKFNNEQVSWMGAIGLMQVLPSTADMHGFVNLQHPQTNLRTGIAHLKYLEKNFSHIDSLNRIKFTLAAYNVGTGHIYDAQRLASHLGLNPKVWDGNVAEALLLKSQKEYYSLPECRNGYCRGSEPYKYVYEILERYDHYKVLVP